MAGGISSARAGRVLRLGRKPAVAGERGLPKPEVFEAQVSSAGMAGDYNLYRQTKKNGDPDMALLLMPVETIEEIRRDGWPVQPGDLGENVTLEGVAYSELRPGRRLRVGRVIVEVSKPCEPCDNLYALPYVGAARGPQFLKGMLNRRGWYARVREPGIVRKGDVVELLPSASGP